MKTLTRQKRMIDLHAEINAMERSLDIVETVWDDLPLPPPQATNAPAVLGAFFLVVLLALFALGGWLATHKPDGIPGPVILTHQQEVQENAQWQREINLDTQRELAEENAIAAQQAAITKEQPNP